MTTGPTPIEGVERTNVEMLCPQQREGIVQRNLYTMEVDRGRNCYICRKFRHIARHCRNKGRRARIRNSRRLEYGQRKRERSIKYKDNLKEEKNLESLN